MKVPAWAYQGPPLSPGELDALRHGAQGLTTQELADSRGCSVETVKTQRRMIIAKLRARNFAHAVAIAAAQGLLEGLDLRRH